MPYRRYAKRKFVKKPKRKVYRRKYNSFKAAPKYYVESGSTSTSTTMSQYNLADGISQGTSSAQRLGEKIWIGGLKLNYNVTGADTSNIVRVVVLCPRSPGIQPPTLFIDTQIDRRFWTVLYDKRHNLLSATSADHYQHVIRRYLKINRTLQYTGTSGGAGVGYLVGPSPWLLLVSDSTAGPNPTVSHNTTVVFKDCLM